MRNPFSCALLVTCIITASLLADPAHSVEPASYVASLIEDLGLRETPKPIKDSPYWKKPMKVVVFLPDSRIPARDDYKAWLHSAAGDAQLIFINSPEELELAKVDADVYLGYCHHVTPDMKNLRWVQNYFVGIDRCMDNELLLEGKVLLTNTKAIPGPGMAEHTMAMMLMLKYEE